MLLHTDIGYARLAQMPAPLMIIPVQKRDQRRHVPKLYPFNDFRQLTLSMTDGVAPCAF